jgi:hypothetical protein
VIYAEHEMAETEDPTTNKRKASPERPEEDATGKRLKLEDGNATEVKEACDDTGSIEEEHQREAPTEASSTTQTHQAGPEQEPRRASDARRPSAAGGPPARRNISIEEKKRGQRLFGGLVSALSRTPSEAQQQKRLEIERRQHEKAQQRRAEDEKRRAEKLEQLKRTRQIEQVKLDEQVVRHYSLFFSPSGLLT